MYVANADKERSYDSVWLSVSAFKNDVQIKEA